MAPSSGFLDFAISMRPDYHQAIIDTIRFYGWDKIIYLYDSHDGKCLLLLEYVFAVYEAPSRCEWHAFVL